MQVSGKRERESLTTELNSPPTSRRLFVTDQVTADRFLVDTGSDVSIYPRRDGHSKSIPLSYQLFAANGSVINTYGTTTLLVQLGLRRDLLWRFVIADVSRSIIGADLLSHYGARH